MKVQKPPQRLNVKFTPIKNFFLSHPWVFFFILLAIGLYLRFYHIQEAVQFNWDQGRDAWTIRDIIQGRFVLLGPATGVGHMHLGPVYYYLLTPFFYLTHLDPMGSNYLNILANFINFIIIFVVTKKIFGNFAAIFATFVYTFSHYLISVNQIPWNVTTMPGVAALIFFCIYKINNGSYKWIFLLWTLTGFYWNLHFTAIFIPLINILSLIFVKDKLRTLKYSLLSIPLFLVWFLPNIIAAITKNADTGLIRDFLSYYFIGFHFRFLLYRIPEALIQFQTILYNPLLTPLKFILPAVYFVLLIFEKDKNKKLFGYLISLWFIVPLIGFTAYGGPLSEYYFLYDVPMVLFILIYLQEKLLRAPFLPVLIVLTVFWLSWAYQNTTDLWIKPDHGGLMSQKIDIKRVVANGENLPYTEGDIRSYLFFIWAVDKQKMQ